MTQRDDDISGGDRISTLGLSLIVGAFNIGEFKSVLLFPK